MVCRVAMSSPQLRPVWKAGARMDPIGTLTREGSDVDAGKGDQPLENESLNVTDFPIFRRGHWTKCNDSLSATESPRKVCKIGVPDSADCWSLWFAPLFWEMAAEFSGLDLTSCQGFWVKRWSVNTWLKYQTSPNWRSKHQPQTGRFNTITTLQEMLKSTLLGNGRACGQPSRPSRGKVGSDDERCLHFVMGRHGGSWTKVGYPMISLFPKMCEFIGKLVGAMNWVAQPRDRRFLVRIIYFQWFVINEDLWPEMWIRMNKVW